MTIYHGTPYTYIIGWTKQNKFYYGVRFAIGCHPNDLWTEYFTSSKHVWKFMKEHGNPDIIQVRKIFKSPEAARLWESKVLKKLKVRSNPVWINRTDNQCFTKANDMIVCKNIHSGETTTLHVDDFRKSTEYVGIRKGMPSPFKDRQHTENAKNLVSIKNTGKKYPEHSKRMAGKNNPMYGTRRDDSTIKKQVATLKQTLSENPEMSEMLSSRSYNSGFNKCVSGTIWINNGCVNKRIKPEDLYKHPGFVQGRLC